MICFNRPQIHLVLKYQSWGRGSSYQQGLGSGRWPMKMVLEHHGQAQTGKPPGSLLTDEASLCFRLGHYPLLYLHLIKVHFVKYNYYSMICLLYKKRKWVLPPPEGRRALAHVNTVLGWAGLPRVCEVRWVCTLLLRERPYCTLARVARWSDHSSGYAHQLSRLPVPQHEG